MKNMKTIAKGLAAITLFSLLNIFGVTAQDTNAGASQPQNTNAPVKEDDSKRNTGIKCSHISYSKFTPFNTSISFAVSFFLGIRILCS